MRHNLNNESENTDRWLVSYADFITLLFAFFVVMYSVSQVNEGKFKILSETLTDAFQQPERSLQPIQIGEVNKSDTVTSGESTYPEENNNIEELVTEPATPETDESFTQLKQELAESLKELIKDDLVRIRSNQDYLQVELQEPRIFASGDSVIRQAFLPIINELIDKSIDSKNAIIISGYTDNLPIFGRRFPSNWALSSARAASVAKEFVSKGVDPSRITVRGYGEYHPIASNDTPEGRDQNRRVVVQFSRKPPQKSDLERQAIEEARSSAVNAAISSNQPTNSGISINQNTDSPITIIRAPDGSLIVRGTNTQNNDDANQ